MKITEKDIHNRYVLCRYVFSKFDIQIKELGETFLQDATKEIIIVELFKRSDSFFLEINVLSFSREIR